MKNRYPGRCEVCGERVETGAGEAYRRESVWVVRHTEHGLSDTVMVAERPLPSAEESYTLLSGHTASQYQAAVFDHFRYGTSSAIVRAVAGSGKTTTIKNALRYLPPHLNVQLLAFNVEAAAQLKAAIVELETADGRSYRNVRAGTFHSVGYGAVRKYLAGVVSKLEPDTGKVRKLFRAMCGDSDAGKDQYRLYRAFATQLVGLAKGEGIGALVPDTEEAWWGIVAHHGLHLASEDASQEEGVAIARSLLRNSNGAAQQGSVDYDDLLYLVCLWKLRLWQNDVVVADEAQDTNPVRRAMLHLLLRHGGRLYAVGDERQAIYGFTGATNDALEIVSQEFRARELPLTVSYRCARAIVERAQTWVPYIEPSDAAPDGAVLDETPLCEALAMLEPTDAVLCRNTAPLVTVAYALIARGRPCRILGREIGDGLVALIEQQRARGVDRLVEKLGNYRDREVAALTARGEEVAADAVADRVECVLVIAAGLPETERTVPALIACIQGMFQDQASGTVQTVLTLCTVHKAKGREWQKVAILCPELMPSRAARQDWQHDQEINLQYVAATRAKSLLVYCEAEDIAVERAQ